MRAIRLSSLALLAFSVTLTTFSAGSLFVSCKGVEAPTSAQVEAGAPIAEGACQLLEVYTGSTVLETICATSPELVLIAETVLARRNYADSGYRYDEVCQHVPRTTVCATSSELHEAIKVVLAQRRARFLVDAGLQ